MPPGPALVLAVINPNAEAQLILADLNLFLLALGHLTDRTGGRRHL